MRYVGIDPSTKTGIVVIDGDQTFSKEITSKVKKDPERFYDITAQILNWLQEGDKIAIEGFSYGSKGRGVSTQYGVGWIIRGELIKNGYSYTEVTPNAVKKFATGKGNEKKENMVLPIYKHWGFENPSDNIRDAFVLAQVMKGMYGLSRLTKYQIDVINNIGN